METKKLFKFKRGAKVSGVCTGIAVYLGLDVTLVRLIFVILAIVGGPGVILYIICAVVMPEESENIDYTYYEKNKDEENHN